MNMNRVFPQTAIVTEVGTEHKVYSSNFPILCAVASGCADYKKNVEGRVSFGPVLCGARGGAVG